MIEAIYNFKNIISFGNSGTISGIVITLFLLLGIIVMFIGASSFQSRNSSAEG